MLSAGAVHAIGEAFEGSLMVNRYLGGDAGPSASTALLAGQQMVARNLAVFGEVEFGDGASWYGFGARYFIH